MAQIYTWVAWRGTHHWILKRPCKHHPPNQCFLSQEFLSPKSLGWSIHPPWTLDGRRIRKDDHGAMLCAPIDMKTKFVDTSISKRGSTWKFRKDRWIIITQDATVRHLTVSIQPNSTLTAEKMTSNYTYTKLIKYINIDRFLNKMHQTITISSPLIDVHEQFLMTLWYFDVCNEEVSTDTVGKVCSKAI